jgi:hypothetical protein
MGQTRKNLLSYRNKYISKIDLTNSLTAIIIPSMKVKKIKIIGVNIC